MLAGTDIVPFIKKYPGRAVSVHLKEWTDDPKGAVVGAGKIDWSELFRVCESVGGTDVYIVEQEIYPVSPLDDCKLSLENLRTMGK